MIINTKKYMIVSNDYPIQFHAGDGCMSDFFEEALFYKSEEGANTELLTFDEPEIFSILEVNITYEF